MNFTKFQLLAPYLSLQDSTLFFGLNCMEFVMTDFFAIFRDDHLSLFFK